MQRLLKLVTWDWVLVALLFLAAAVLRVWGVNWSLPYVIHPDESRIVDAGVHIIKAGDFDPHFYYYPSLPIYLQTGVYWLNLTWGTFRGYYAGPQSLPDQNQIFALAPQLYLWGRTLSALIGAATVAGIYALGKAVFGRAAGIAAALLLLTSPLHVENSHYLMTDAALVGGILAAMAGAWWLANHPTGRVALLAGALAGLAAAAKYNGAYVALLPATGWLMAWKPHRDGKWAGVWRWIAVAAGMALAGLAVFVVTNPSMIFDWPAWSRSFRVLMEINVPAQSLDDMVQAFGKQAQALLDHEPMILWPGLVGGLTLLGAAIRSSDTRLKRAAWLFLPFPLVYMLVMSRFTVVYPRHVLVLLPFLCLWAGFGISRAAAWVTNHIPEVRPRLVRDPVLLTCVVSLVLIVEPARQMVNFDRYLASTDSRLAAYSWMLSQLQAGHRFAVELEPWLVCAPPEWKCPAPDVYAPLQPLTNKPPSWYADRGYDYVMLVGKEEAILEQAEVSGPRPQEALAPYLQLPLVREFPGDHGGGKGPLVLVYRTTQGDPLSLKNVTPLGDRFGDVAELVGFAMSPLAQATQAYDPADGPASSRDGYKAGQVLGIDLYWRALKAGQGDIHNWTVAVHVTDASGAVVAQVDVQPISSGRLRPVSEWYQNEFLAGEYNVPLPATLPPGTYHVTVGLYDAPAGGGLPVYPAGTQADSGTVGAPAADLGEITVR